MTKEEKKMWKEACSKIEVSAYSIMEQVFKFIKGHTEELPLILYDKDKLKDGEADDEFYDLPYAYFVDKYESYNEGKIVEIQGENVLLVFSGDEFPNTHELELSEVPFVTQVELLSYLEKRF